MTATAVQLKLDYFKIYDVVPQGLSDWVTLQGQFDREAERAQVVHLEYFANAASKNQEPLFDKYSHLTWYSIVDRVAEPTRRVEVENQFGVQTFLTGAAVGLLAPAQTFEQGSQFPERLDHFKVYRVQDGTSVKKKVTLKDPFGSSDTIVTTPFYFAVPVTKEHGQTTTKIKNKQAHLVIYAISPAGAPRTELVRDQFSRHQLQISRSIYLAAPSIKLKWTGVPA